ncbi:MAG: outer membrane protein assembly factor BamD [Alphaproteobacteria bacterium]|nr:outer membrane protein assembly factor BamD [Alphaproteobacteria bacterium]
MITLKGSLIAVAVLLLGACVDTEDSYVEQPVEELYNRAVDLAEEKEYEVAAEAFDEVERQHPFSVWATRAQLMAAYAYYQANAYDESIIAADRFVQLHPGHDDVDYAYYLIALSYYEQISDVQRDQRLTELAMKALDEVVQRFPGTDYARDAKLKIDLAHDHLAGKEMAIGRFYQGRSDHIGAINRFRTVLEKYQTTSHVPEALHRLVETYLALGVETEAQTAAAVLGYNFPGSGWYVDSYRLLVDNNLEPIEDEGSWISRAFGGLL